MQESLSVILKNQLSELERVSVLLEEFGELHGLLPKMVFQMNLVLDEIITNIVSYGYDDDQEHGIAVEITCQEGVIILTIADDGRPFNPLDIPLPDLEASAEERKEGGLGFHFVRNLMDVVEYRRHGGQNELRLEKNCGIYSSGGKS